MHCWVCAAPYPSVETRLSAGCAPRLVCASPTFPPTRSSAKLMQQGSAADMAAAAASRVLKARTARLMTCGWVVRRLSSRRRCLHRHKPRNIPTDPAPTQQRLHTPTYCTTPHHHVCTRPCTRPLPKSLGLSQSQVVTYRGVEIRILLPPASETFLLLKKTSQHGHQARSRRLTNHPRSAQFSSQIFSAAVDISWPRAADSSQFSSQIFSAAVDISWPRAADSSQFSSWSSLLSRYRTCTFLVSGMIHFEYSSPTISGGTLYLISFCSAPSTSTSCP